MQTNCVRILCVAALSAACGPPSGTLIAGTPKSGALTVGDVASIRGGTMRVQDTETIGVGEVVTITLCATGFDPYLVFSKEGTAATIVAENDDGAGDQNARVIYTPAAADRNQLYTVHVTTYRDEIPPATATWTLKAENARNPLLGCP